MQVWRTRITCTCNPVLATHKPCIPPILPLYIHTKDYYSTESFETENIYRKIVE